MNNEEIKEKFKVVGDKILVKPIIKEEKVETVSKGGIILDEALAARIAAEAEQGKPPIDTYQGIVLAAGPDAGVAKEGDILTLPEHGVHPVLDLEGERYKIVREPDILLIESA